MCITQLLKTLSFSNTLPISDFLLFFGNYGLVGLCGAGQEQAWDNPEMALPWETGQLAGNALRKKGYRSHKAAVTPMFCLRSSWHRVFPFASSIFHVPTPLQSFPYPSLVCYCSTQTGDTFTALVVLYELAGTWIYWNTKQWRQSSGTLNWEGKGSMDVCCLHSSIADKLPLLVMPVLVKQKLVQEAVTHLHLWCDHSKRHSSVSLFSPPHTAWYTILQLFAWRALLNQVQRYCHISEPPTLLKPYTR